MRVPDCNSIRSHPGGVEPTVYFRILHTSEEGHNIAPVAAYCKQGAEIVLGPKAMLENNKISASTSRMPYDKMDGATLPPPGEPRTPRIVELVCKAIEWRRQLNAGEVRNQADIARREGISRARVTQVMSLLRLTPEIKERILSLPDTLHRSVVTERMLRPIGAIPDYRDRLREFRTKME